MEIKYTTHFLHKLEDLFAETDYILRYEKGQFKSGYCLLKENKVAVVNKFYSLEGKISCLVEIIREINIAEEKLSPKNRDLLKRLLQTELKL
jgi:hypothetical protein